MVREGRGNKKVTEEIIAARSRIRELERQLAALSSSPGAENTIEALLNVNPEISLVVDRSGTVLQANGRAATRLSRKIEELVGSCFFDLFSQPESDLMKGWVDEVVESHKVVRFADKHEGRHYDVHYYPIADDAGEVSSVAILAVDVTVAKYTEQALKAERKKFRLLTENLPMGISLLTRSGRYLYLNSKFKETFGYDLVDIPDGRSWFRLAYPRKSYRQKVMQTWFEDFGHFTPGEKKPWIFNVTCKDGAEKIIHFLPVQLESGEVLITYEDFTELVTARMQLEESEAKFRLLFEKSIDAIIIMENDRILDCNAAAVQMFGASEKSELLGRGPLYLSPEMQPDGRLSRVRAEEIKSRYMREGSSRFEWLFRTFDHRELIVDVSINLIHFKNRTLIYAVWKDVTDRKRAEQRIAHHSSFPRLSPSPIIEFDAAGAVTYTNRAALVALEKYGLEPDPQLYLPQDVPAIAKKLAEENVEHYSCRRVIGAATFEELIHYVGQFQRIRIYATDVTERTAAEEALKKSEERYRGMFDNIPLPALVYEFKTLAITDVNRAAVDHYGYPRDEFLQMSLKDLSLDEEIPGLPNHPGKPFFEQSSGPWKHKKKDGTIIDVDVTGHALESFARKHRIVIIHDITERRRAEEMLRFTKFAVDSAAVAIFWIEEDGKLLYVNDEACVSLGYTRPELLSMAVFDFDPGNRRETWHKTWAKVKKMRSMTAESVHRAKNGYVFPVEITGNYMEYEGKGYICSIATNIAERKKTEAALRASEERYRKMFQDNPLPAFVFDFETLRIVDVNDSAVEHYGYSRQELLNLSMRDIRPPEDIADLERTLGMPDHEVRKVPYLRHRKKDGTIINVIVSAHDLHLGERRFRIIQVNDVTDRRRSEEALRFTQFAVDRAAVGIVWVDESARFVYVNDEACKSLGYSREELLTMTVHDIDLYYQREEWMEFLKDIKAKGSLSLESSNIRKDGSIFPVEITGNCMEFGGKNYICAILQNISERKRHEEALKKREIELENKSASLEEANTALKVLLRNREGDRAEQEDRIASNLKELILPYVEKLKKTRLDFGQGAILDIIDTNLHDIFSPFLQNMSSKFAHFTPSELQVASLIKAGKTSKEIAETLRVSTGTIDTHRNNIRAKLKLNNKKINLRTYLLTLE